MSFETKLLSQFVKIHITDKALHTFSNNNRKCVMDKNNFSVYKYTLTILLNEQHVISVDHFAYTTYQSCNTN